MKMKRSFPLLNLLSALLFLSFIAFLEHNRATFAYEISTLERAAIYAVVAVSMNLLTGFTGLFSLGQAGFMAIGAYVTAILTIPVESRAAVYYVDGISPAIAHMEAPFFVAILIGGLLSAGIAALIGIPVLRLKSDYLAIATLGFSEIIRALLSAPQFNRITNGSFGLKNIPAFPNLFVFFGIVSLCIGFMVLLINSSYGRVFQAIREDEIAAESMGINLFRYKELSFVISSFFTGIGGGMLAMFMRSIDSKTFQVGLTYDILLIVVLGGIGSVSGSILGSLLITFGREWLRFFDEPLSLFGVRIPLFRSGFRMVIFSLLLMIVVLYYRKGLMGTTEFSWRRLFFRFQTLSKRLQKGADPKKKKEESAS